MHDVNTRTLSDCTDEVKPWYPFASLHPFANTSPRNIIHAYLSSPVSRYLSPAAFLSRSPETERRKNTNERVGWKDKSRDETRRRKGRKRRTTLVNIPTCIPRLLCTFVYSTWFVITGLAFSFSWCNVGLNSRFYRFFFFPQIAGNELN